MYIVLALTFLGENACDYNGVPELKIKRLNKQCCFSIQALSVNEALEPDSDKLTMPLLAFCRQLVTHNVNWYSPSLKVK
jgi:hypothetical protein